MAFHEEPVSAFEQTPSLNKSTDLWSHLPPKTSFWLGMLGGILSLGTIGFLILILITMRKL